MKDSNGFSIIIPIYKGLQYIPHLCELIQHNADTLIQHGVNLPVEVVFVNDYPLEPFSNENQIVSLNDVKKIMVTHEKNMGIHQSRIDGLQASHGDMILFFDQDDEIADDYLLSQYLRLKKKKADMVIANGYYKMPTGLFLIYRNWLSQKAAQRFAMYVRTGNHIVSPGMCLIKRNAIPEEWCKKALTINGADDYYLWLLMGIKNSTFHPAINRAVIYTHCFTGDNCSNDSNLMDKSVLETREKLKDINAKANWVYDVMGYRLGVLDDDELPNLSVADKFVFFLWNCYIKMKSIVRKIKKMS